MADQYEFELKIEGEGKSETIQLGDGATRIGRIEGNNIVLPHNFVSSRHAQIDCTATTCTITDLGSTNGTIVDGQALIKNKPQSLTPESAIRIGPYQLAVSFQQSAVSPSTGSGRGPSTSSGQGEQSSVVRRPSSQSNQEPPPPTIPPTYIPSSQRRPPPDYSQLSAGLSRHSVHFLHFLPGIFQVDSEYDPILYDLDLGDISAPILKRLINNALTRLPSIAGKFEVDTLTTKLRSLVRGGDEALSEAEATVIAVIRDDHARIRRMIGNHPNSFLSRYLAILEAIFLPLQWTVDNFDVFLHPATAPRDFLPWLANWYDITFDYTWSEAKRRQLLAEAYEIFALRGTRKALSRVLEIYTGRSPEILDLEDKDKPFSFTVKLPVTVDEVKPALVEQIIDLNKPAHTTYKLLYRRN